MSADDSRAEKSIKKVPELSLIDLVDSKLHIDSKSPKLRNDKVANDEEHCVSHLMLLS